MKRITSKKIALTRETLLSLERNLPHIAGGGKIQCSVRICPPDNASENPCSAGCTVSCV
jgi:hypothetical protein